MESLTTQQPFRDRTLWSIIAGELDIDHTSGDAKRIVDIGGGTGGLAVPLAQHGYDVTVIDPSPNALAGLTRRAREAGVANQVHAVQADAHAVSEWLEPQSARLVLCHSVLEMVDSPEESMLAMSEIIADGGALSLVAANRAGAVLSRVVAGNIGQAMAILRDVDGRSSTHDTLLRRFDPESLQQLISVAGLTCETIHGLRTVSDIVPGLRETENNPSAVLAAFESATAETSPYRDIAAQLHVLARKPHQR